MRMLECFLCWGSPFPQHLYKLTQRRRGGREGLCVSHGKYARLKVILEEKFPFNYTYYTVAHKCRIALLGRRAYLFNVWKMRNSKRHPCINGRLRKVCVDSLSSTPLHTIKSTKHIWHAVFSPCAPVQTLHLDEPVTGSKQNKEATNKPKQMQTHYTTPTQI